MIALLVVVIVLPLVFVFLSWRTVGSAGIETKLDQGVTVTEPASEEITPSGETTVNPPPAKTEPDPPRIPPAR